jgi:circadian clock protein KaiB
VRQKSPGRVRLRRRLRLYVAGTTLRSLRAVENITRLLEQHLPGRFHLEVVDVYRQPARARQDQIVVLPTLIQYHPGGAKRLVGDLTQISQVRKELDLVSAEG